MNRPLVCSFESRRSTEMSRLVEKMGGEPFVAPSMQEVPLEDNPSAVSGIQQLVDGHINALLVTTGVGTAAMMELAKANNLTGPLLSQLGTIPIFARGPKPVVELARHNLKPTAKAAEPNTWRELVSCIDESEFSLDGLTIAVQEYGATNPELNAELHERGATVVSIPVYRWALPDDTTPLESAISRTISGDFAALLFTSAQQVRHVLAVADRKSQVADWVAAANRSVVASIGPTCTEALEESGLRVRCEASPPKMGQLVKTALALINDEPSSQ